MYLFHLNKFIVNMDIETIEPIITQYFQSNQYDGVHMYKLKGAITPTPKGATCPPLSPLTPTSTLPTTSGIVPTASGIAEL